MNVTLDLTGESSRLLVSGIPHEYALYIIDTDLHDYNLRMADPGNKLAYTYILGRLTIAGQERWLRNFCEVYSFAYKVEYPFPPMP